jgi:glycosyltransferase involved in cell wall biosynthesis
MAETSVIIPVLNGQDYIREALESVLTQLSLDDEVLVIDDGSSDETWDLVESFDRRVRIFRGPGKGPSAARNLGLTRSSGSLVAFLDHDDIWPAGRHAALVGTLRSSPNIDVAVGRLRVRVETVADPAENQRYLAWDGSYAPSMIGSCLYLRRILIEVSGFNEKLTRGEDSDLFVRLVRRGAVIKNADCEALVYRRHGKNMTNAPLEFSALAFQLVRARRGA